MMIKCSEVRNTNYLIDSVKTKSMSVAIGWYFSNYATLKYMLILIAFTVLKHFSDLIVSFLAREAIARHQLPERKGFMILLLITIICELIFSNAMDEIKNFLNACILNASRTQLQDALSYLNTSSMSSYSTWRLYQVNQVTLDFIFRAISIIGSIITFVLVVKMLCDTRVNPIGPGHFDIRNFLSLLALSVVFVIANSVIRSSVPHISTTYEDDYDQIAQYSQLINRCGQMDYAHSVLNNRFNDYDMRKIKQSFFIAAANTAILTGCCMAFYYDVERSGFITRIINYQHNREILHYVSVLMAALVSIMFYISSLLEKVKSFKHHCNFLAPLLYDSIPNKNIVSFQYFSTKFTDLSFNLEKFKEVADLFMEGSWESRENAIRILDNAIYTDSTSEIKKLIENVKNEENKKKLQELYDEVVLIKNCDVRIGHNRISFVEQGVTYDIKFKKKMLMCIRGDSGSGKTSLIKLLFGLNSHPQVKTTINGHSIQQVRLDQLSKFVAVVLQKPYAFSRFTIMDNFRFLGATDEDKIKSELIRFGIYDKVKGSMNEVLGYLYLSGGEFFRLVFSFLYAADKKPPIVVIDECFSALDKETQKKILQTIIEENGENFDGTHGSSVIHIEHLGFFRDLCNLDVYLFNKELNFNVRINGSLTDIKTLMNNKTELVNDDYIITKKVAPLNHEEIFNDTDVM